MRKIIDTTKRVEVSEVTKQYARTAYTSLGAVALLLLLGLITNWEFLLVVALIPLGIAVHNGWREQRERFKDRHLARRNLALDNERVKARYDATRMCARCGVFYLEGERNWYSAATLAAPGEGIPLEGRTQITLTKSKAPSTVTLQDVLTSTMDGTRKTISNATIAGPVGTQLCGAEAQTFFVTGTEGGRFRQKAVTVAVSGRAIVGAVLHATPETFDEAWDSYQRVKNSYALLGK